MPKVITHFLNEKIEDYNKIVGSLVAECEAELVKIVPIGKDATVICLEKYYLRNGSYASLTVVLDNQEDGNRATVVGYGGGEGIFNDSLGANSRFADKASEILKSYGFVIEDVQKSDSRI